MISIKPFLSNRSKAPSAQGGFSMVEMLVSIGIVVIVLTIVLTRQDSFNEAVLLRAEAYDVALSVREMQLSAVSVVSDGSGDYSARTGIYFSGNEINQYVFFRDQNGNDQYDVGEDFGAPGTIDPRFTISYIDTSDGGIDGEGITVLFNRPDFDANFYDVNGTSYNHHNSIYVQLAERDSYTFFGDCPDTVATVEITKAGQISVIERVLPWCTTS